MFATSSRERGNAVTRKIVGLVVIAVTLIGCGGGGSDNAGAGNPPGGGYIYHVPPQLSDGWSVGNLESAGINQNSLENMVDQINNRGHSSFVRQVLIVRNNTLVFEEYFGAATINSVSHMQSATKSIVAAIFGIAQGNGFVASIDDSPFDYLPEYQHLNGPQKADISIRHVLSMTPGLEWNENSTPTFGIANDNIAAYSSNNYIRYVLQKDVVTTPGSTWNYNSGCPMILAGIVKNQTGMHIDEYAEQALFGPLDINTLSWEYQSDGLPLATGGLWLRGRDSAKIAQLYLDDGMWQGAQIIPQQWIENSMSVHAAIEPGIDYGYLWWTRDFAGYRLWFASGYGGQLIITVPEEEVAIIINAEYTRSADETGRRQSIIWELLADHVFPAI
jgi:CubicO group peptidase (beta-lactamase class C family)